MRVNEQARSRCPAEADSGNSPAMGKKGAWVECVPACRRERARWFLERLVGPFFLFLVDRCHAARIVGYVHICPPPKRQRLSNERKDTKSPPKSPAKKNTNRETTCTNLRMVVGQLFSTCATTPLAVGTISRRRRNDINNHHQQQLNKREARAAVQKHTSLPHSRKARGTSPMRVSAALSHSSGSSGAAHRIEESNCASPAPLTTTARTPLRERGHTRQRKRKAGGVSIEPENRRNYLCSLCRGLWPAHLGYIAGLTPFVDNTAVPTAVQPVYIHLQNARNITQKVSVYY